ncbi:MAG: cobalamin-binding protein, partial [Betaproteobacteria bacterium]|nr:cobalamin-binding protein [Betaproteobacteria bacterium]
MTRLVALLLFVACGAAGAEVRVRDDAGAEVVLAAPARRIVSLAPHATELLYAAGAGKRVVAVVRGSDHP